ncbi:hypothetical protein [Sphingobium olei]|uniref:Uncharacterized protein n=1 Tax=Sphingobium olei TaxID=420955 RepID=A0ABW3P2J6_9SPHN
MTCDPNDLTTADIDALWARDPDRRGPVLITLGLDIEELPLCAFCPMARWYVQDDAVYAFCKEYRDIKYTGAGKGVSYCDAYVITINDPAREA